MVPGKEYSDHFDKDGIVGAPDPEQNIAWDGVVPGGVADTFDYSGSRVPVFGDTTDGEVDALANVSDALYDAVISATPKFGGGGPGAALLFSTDLSANITFESISGVSATWAFGTPPFPPGNDIDQHGVVDLDGLEVWGEDGPAGDDGNRYSLEFDGIVDPGNLNRVAVFSFGLGGVSSSLFYSNELAAAISILAGLTPAQFSVLNTFMDVDATMTSTPGPALNRPTSLNIPHRIMWSIDPLNVGGGVVFDGGEIFVWDRALGGAANYLVHGGHVWNTAFPVAATFGLPSENVNALEAVAVPEPSTALLTGFGLLMGLAVGRRWRRKR